MLRPPNTDNKGYKTCHGFCIPIAIGTFLLSREHSIRGYHRDCAAALNKTRVRGQVTCSQPTLYRDTRKTQKTRNLTAKTAPWFVHYGCVPGLYPDSKLLLTAFMPKPTQTTLYCRAVMGHVQCHRDKFQTEHFL